MYPLETGLYVTYFPPNTDMLCTSPLYNSLLVNDGYNIHKKIKSTTTLFRLLNIRTFLKTYTSLLLLSNIAYIRGYTTKSKTEGFQN